MPGYTHRNLLGLDDLAAGQNIGIQARFARGPLETEHLGVTLMVYEPDVRSPMAHSHREQEEVYVVVAGSGRMRLDDDVVDLQPWDAVRVAPGTVRAFHSGPDGLELLAVGSDRPEGGDGEIAEGEVWPA